MNDATAFAMGRILIAIIENNQTADGKIQIPTVLQPYMHGKTIIG
jgi:seryl-tRNA synthetase